jgi:hypothetical protein
MVSMNRDRYKYAKQSGFVVSCIVMINILVCLDVKAGQSELADSVKRKDWTIFALYQQGSVLQSNPFLRGSNINHRPIKSFRAISMEFLWQTTGKKLWEQLYNYPRYGIGLYNVRFVNSNELGSPVAVYGKLEIPILRYEKFSFMTHLGGGFAFNWKSYSENRFNFVMGADESFFSEGGLSLEYKLTPELLIDAGITFTHFSNGALKVPNDGVNLFGPKISLGYNFDNIKTEYARHPVPVFQKNTELFISFFTAFKNETLNSRDTINGSKYGSIYYSIGGLSMAINRQVGYRSKFGVGIMAAYLGSANSSIIIENGKCVDKNASFREGFELSIFPSYELVIARLSILFQPAVYLYRAKYPSRDPGTYQRIGIKYNVVNDLYLGLFLHGYKFNTSDYVEITFGYRLHL